MKTYPLRDDRGELYAFEVPSSWFLGSRGIARYFARCPGVSISRVRRLFARGEDVHVEFEFAGHSFRVWEPHGDSSRYWVGSSSDPSLRRAGIDELEAFVQRTWPGPVSRALESLASRFTGRHAV